MQPKEPATEFPEPQETKEFCLSFKLILNYLSFLV